MLILGIFFLMQIVVGANIDVFCMSDYDSDDHRHLGRFGGVTSQPRRVNTKP